MHRIGHGDILIDHGDIRREYAKKKLSDTRQGVAAPVAMSRGPTANTYTFWYFAELAVARRLRASFFGGKQPL
jgi:hypothetical protein